MKQGLQYLIIGAFALFAVWIMNTAAYNPHAISHAECRQIIGDSVSNRMLTATAQDSIAAMRSMINGKTTMSAVLSALSVQSGSLAYNSSTGVFTIPSSSGGTVTSLGVTSSDLDVSNTPVTTSGNITVNVKDQYKIQRYNGSGLITSVCKEWYGIITPSSSSGQTVDISSAGFSAIHSIQVSAANNTGSATSVPLVGIKSYTTSQITLNIVSSNNNTIASLLSPIIGLIFPSSVAGYTIHVVVKGA